MIRTFYLTVIQRNYMGQPRMETVRSYDPQVAINFYLEENNHDELVWACDDSEQDALESQNNFLFFQLNPNLAI